MAINVKGPYFLTQLAARWMIEQITPHASRLTSPPKIITISSISAYTASTNRGDYCVSKAALSMLTPLFATRLAEHGINVYEIRPGVIATDMTGEGKMTVHRRWTDAHPALGPPEASVAPWPSWRRVSQHQRSHRGQWFPLANYSRRSVEARNTKPIFNSR
jgi:NAD(P)-dependent dehydrogenase (short-subunit alcohol dehydrogenase family)